MAEQVPVGSSMYGPKKRKIVYETKLDAYKVSDHCGMPEHYFLIVANEKEDLCLDLSKEVEALFEEGKKYLLQIYALE